MSEMFSTFGVATSGMGAYKTWLNAVADNISNMDNVTATSQPAFQERFIQVEAQSSPDGLGAGVQVSAVRFGSPDGIVNYEPNHPLADQNGMVRKPDINLSEQMVYMQLAQRGYQANVRSFETAKELYESILSIGR